MKPSRIILLAIAVLLYSAAVWFFDPFVMLLGAFMVVYLGASAFQAAGLIAGITTARPASGRSPPNKPGEQE